MCSKWEDYLNLVDFSYNNGHQESLGLTPFKALYGRKCRTPDSWEYPVKRVVFGPQMLKEVEHEVFKIEHNLKVAQDRQKSYANLKRMHREGLDTMLILE